PIYSDGLLRIPRQRRDRFLPAIGRTFLSVQYREQNFSKPLRNKSARAGVGNYWPYRRFQKGLLDLENSYLHVRCMRREVAEYTDFHFVVVVTAAEHEMVAEVARRQIARHETELSNVL